MLGQIRDGLLDNTSVVCGKAFLTFYTELPARKDACNVSIFQQKYLIDVYYSLKVNPLNSITVKNERLVL